MGFSPMRLNGGKMRVQHAAAATVGHWMVDSRGEETRKNSEEQRRWGVAKNRGIEPCDLSVPRLVGLVRYEKSENRYFLDCLCF
mmetsp:Transcript_28420/g.65017  ORF Transcript_28420/g.65017 Transcript_28420/m.65017 type:complete len:84 (-) Transcript_28420:225-476(-)